MVRQDKERWQSSKLKTCEESFETGKLWKNILGWLNWCSSSSPSKLLCNGKIETFPSKMAEIQNKFYVDQVHTIRNDLGGYDTGDPLELLRHRLAGFPEKFSTKPIKPEEVAKIISQLKNSKASGIDNLDTYILS